MENFIFIQCNLNRRAVSMVNVDDTCDVWIYAADMKIT